MHRIQQCKITDLVNVLKSQAELPFLNTYGCNLLVGAGCSSEAGIPTAAEMVKELSGKTGQECKHQIEFDGAVVRRHLRYLKGKCIDSICHMQDVERVPIEKLWTIENMLLSSEDDYNVIMSSFPPAKRRRIINTTVCGKQPTDTHRIIAAMVHARYVGRVMTTNFDKLIEKAMKTMNEEVFRTSPIQYSTLDVMNDRFNRPIPGKVQVVHLHGVDGSFLQASDLMEYERNASRIGRHFRNATFCGPWLVVGYSGDCDIVLDLLCRQESRIFQDGLFWVSYMNLPSQKVQRSLLERFESAFLIFDEEGSDSFFRHLAQLLNLKWKTQIREGE